MHHFERLQTGFIVFVAIAIVTLVHHHDLVATKTDIPPEAITVLAVLLSIGGAVLAKSLGQYAFGFEQIRMWVMGTRYVEGYWLTHTEPADNNDQSALLGYAVAYMHYDRMAKVFSVETTRLDEQGKRFTTTSITATVPIDEPVIRYINYFRIIGSKYDGKTGISEGHFSITEGFSRFPRHFDATLTIIGESNQRSQTSEKISWEKVRELRRKYKGEDDWTIAHLSVLRKESREDDVGKKGEVYT